MPDYSNTCIYKICCLDPAIGNIYVGSTCNFKRRESEHKKQCNNEQHQHYNVHLYKFIREHGGWHNWRMIEVEKIKCTNKKEKINLNLNLYKN